MAFEIPESVIDFVRTTFLQANNKVSTALTLQPSLHEEALDQMLIMELTATPPTFFEEDKAAVAIETHWLGNRWMHERWEIADIALFVILRRSGKLDVRKTALMQTKRLYSREIPAAELEEFDYRVGIGRIADKTDQIFPLSTQRAFSFDDECVFGAMKSGSAQVKRIEEYISKEKIPVYYGFYCPLEIPFSELFPRTSNSVEIDNTFGCRIQSSVDVHNTLNKVVSGKPPCLREIKANTEGSCFGWSLEHFVADEVLRCREGKLFDDASDENLRSLLYERSAPIAAAISISIDISSD